MIMLREFSKGTQRFAVRTPLDPVGTNETRICFSDRTEIQNFFGNAMRDAITGAAIQRIAQDVAPTFSLRSLNSPPQLSGPERLNYLFSEIAKDHVHMVLKDGAEKRKPDVDHTEHSFLERTDILKFVKRQVNHLKKMFSRMVHADYHVLETVYNYDENSTGYVPVVIEPSSVIEHSSGWKSWDDLFEISALGLFKGAVTFRIGDFLGLGSLALAAAGFSASSEHITGQYIATGKSIITREWYGSYAIRYNIKSGYWEIPWIKYRNSGPDQRILVELKRQDRILMHNKVIYTHKAVLVPPSTRMEDYLQSYAQGTPLPEHDVNTPIKL